MHRVKTRKWLTMIDNQLRVSTQAAGLKWFHKSDDVEWTDPFRWPHLSLAMDLESSGNSAWHYLAYDKKCNTTQAGDASHGAHRDFILMLRRMHLYDFWVLLLVWCNVPHGPDADQLRRNQVEACMKRVFEEETASTNVIFQHFARDIWEACREIGTTFDGSCLGTKSFGGS